MSADTIVGLDNDALVETLVQTFGRAGRVKGLDLYIESGVGEYQALFLDGLHVNQTCDFPASSPQMVRITLESRGTVRLTVFADLVRVPRATRLLVTELLHSTVQCYEAIDREESLLEELSADWENLESLYQLSTDVQRSNSVEETLASLVGRLTSAKNGLRAAIFAAKEDVLIRLTGAEVPAGENALSDFGEIAGDVRAGHVAVWKHKETDQTPPGKLLTWLGSSSCAVAPVATRDRNFGYLVLWSDHPSTDLNSSLRRLLEASAHQAGIVLERDRLTRTIRESERVERELEIASAIHQILLVSKPPQLSSQMETAAFNLPSQRIDGDFYDYLTLDDGSVDILLGDVMGEGVSAALVGAATKSHFLRAVAQLSLSRRTEKPPISEIVSSAASALHDSLVTLERFVTCVTYASTCPRNYGFRGLRAHKFDPAPKANG